MEVITRTTKKESGTLAAHHGAGLIKKAIEENGQTRIILATGASQFDMLASLVAIPDIDWSAVTVFHLDEYIGLSKNHPASFRRYLRERFVDALPGPIGRFFYINADTDPKAECRRLNPLISAASIDVAFIGIGENGHLAFNDPPADFRTEVPYLIVDLDEACRRQQLGEGWFATLEDVPQQAISMSIQQILKSESIICTVPDKRKAQVVQMAVEGPVTPDVPSSILQTHSDCYLYLDDEAASKLSTGSS